MVDQYKTSTRKRQQGTILYLTIYDYIKQHKKLPSHLMKKQALNYYVNTLKRAVLIEKTGYGTWNVKGKYSYDLIKKVLRSTSKTLMLATPNASSIRGHGFTVKLKLGTIKNWHLREQYLIQKGLKFKILSSIGGGQLLYYLGKKIKLYKNCIMIYDSKSYLSDTAANSRSYALYYIQEYIHKLEILLNVKLSINKKYKITIDRQHYAKLNDMLARQYRKDGQRLYVRNNNGEIWLIADHSLNIDELETVHNKSAVSDMDDVIKPFLNDLKENRPILPSQHQEYTKELGAAIRINTEHIGIILHLLYPKKPEPPRQQQKIADYIG